MTEAQTDLLLYEGATLVHNHNVDYALSLPDNTAARGNQVRVYAFSPDGVYRSDGLKQDLNFLDALYGRDVENNVLALLEPLGDETSDLRNAALNHSLNLALSKAGLLVGYEFEMGALTRQAMAEAEHRVTSFRYYMASLKPFDLPFAASQFR